MNNLPDIKTIPKFTLKGRIYEASIRTAAIGL